MISTQESSEIPTAPDHRCHSFYDLKLRYCFSNVFGCCLVKINETANEARCKLQITLLIYNKTTIFNLV